MPLALLAGLVIPSPAWGSGAAVIHDCENHGRIQGHYTQKDYSDALAQLNGDVAEYSDCPTLIRQAQLAAARNRGGSGGGAGGGGSAGGGSSGGGAGGGSSTGGGGALGAGAAPVTRAQRQALAAARVSGNAPVQFAGGSLRPGAVHADISSAINTLPSPLLALLIALLAGALAALATLLNRHVRTRRAI